MMLSRRTRQIGWRLTCALALAATVGGAAPARADEDPPALKLNKIQQRLLSGFADLQLNHTDTLARPSRAQSSR
ncbi:MAG: hypothetical protein LC797_07715, partial [Chloroflexi bacterium]|nr:hypothetical protein [Chloroflexota bacterium]